MVSSWSPIVTHWVSLEEVCLTSFEVLNLVASCLDDENEIPLKVIASFSALRFALPINSFHSSPQLGTVISQFLPFMGTNTFLDVYSILAVHARLGLFCGGQHVQYLCWYRFFMESMVSSMDVV